MATLIVSQFVQAPVEVVFATASDLLHAAEFVSGIEKIEPLNPGPVQAGFRWKETRTMLGRTATEELTLTELEPPHRQVIECRSCGALYRSEFRFTPEGAGTKLTLEVSTRAESLLAKMMTPLMGPLMRSTMQKLLEQDVADLAIEAELRTGSGVPLV